MHCILHWGGNSRGFLKVTMSSRNIVPLLWCSCNAAPVLKSWIGICPWLTCSVASLKGGKIVFWGSLSSCVKQPLPLAFKAIRSSESKASQPAKWAVNGSVEWEGPPYTGAQAFAKPTAPRMSPLPQNVTEPVGLDCPKGSPCKICSSWMHLPR